MLGIGLPSASVCKKSICRGRIPASARLGVIALLCLSVFAFASPSSAQTAVVMADLHLINVSRNSICYVFLSMGTSSSWGENLLGNDKVIRDGETFTVKLALGDYDIRILDCEQKTLLEKYNFHFSAESNLRITAGENGGEEIPAKSNGSETQGASLCAWWQNLGRSLDQEKNYERAQMDFENALSCYESENSLVGQGSALNDLGHVYQELGKFDEALNAYQQGLTFVRSANEKEGEIVILIGIARLYADSADPRKAFDHYTQVLNILKSMRQEDQELVILKEIGDLHAKLWQFNDALNTYQQALALSEKLNDEEQQTLILVSIAQLYQERGYYKQALAYYQQMLSIAEKAGNSIQISVALSGIGNIYLSEDQYANALDAFQRTGDYLKLTGYQAKDGYTLGIIAQVYYAQGRYPEALDNLKQALIIYQDADDRKNEADIEKMISLVYEAMGNYPDALDNANSALHIFQELDSKADMASCFNNIGGIYTDQEKYDLALSNYQQALTIYQNIGLSSEAGNVIGNIGGVYHEQGDYTDAFNAYQQALLIAEKTGEREKQGILLSNLGYVLEAEGNYDQAIDLFNQAIDIYESIRTTAGSEQAKSLFISKYTSLYSHIVELLHTLGRDADAFFISEQGRARSFLDSIATSTIQLNDRTAAALFAQEQDAYNNFRMAQDALARASASSIPSDQNTIVGLQTQVTKAENDYKAALDAIRAQGGQLAQLIPGRNALLDLPQSQALLDGQTTLLSFWVMEDKTIVFILTHNSFKAVDLLISRDVLHAQVNAFHSFTNIDTPYPDAAVALYKALIAPIKNDLTTPNLVIVPNGDLHYLSFASLTDGSRYLIDDYTLTYLPSASAWPFIKQNIGHPSTNALILGNPATSANLQALPYAESEAKAIASLLHSTPLLEQVATEGTLMSKSASAGIVHIAAHAAYNPGDPLSSAIYLAPDSANDGSLDVAEIYGLDLSHTDLVVLSACDTQLGLLSTGDDIVGMTRAFLYAGTPSILASLWRVDDRATQDLMVMFYTNWQGGMNKAEALRQAQIKLRAKYPNPYYWASFVLNGDYERTSISQSINSMKTIQPLSTLSIAGIGLILLFIVLVVFTIRRKWKVA